MPRALTAARIAAILAGPALARELPAQDSTFTISSSDITRASAEGFTFEMRELQFGSRCFGASGQNVGKSLSLRLTSEGLNGYAWSVCRHAGFGDRNLQNGWKVSAVQRSTTCQFNDFGTWRTLDGSNCVFNVLNAPVVNSTSAFFRVDATLKGQMLQDRRATMSWSITLRGPRGKSPWKLQSPTAPTLLSPANDALLSGVGSFSWSAPATGAASYKLCISRESFTGSCEVRASPTATSVNNLALPFRGERIRWYVQACNSAGCTSSSNSRVIRNLLPSAALVSPAANATATSRRPTFQWQAVAGAQTYTLYVSHPSPLQSFSVPNLSSSVTSFTPATDLTLESPVVWVVRACTTAVGCSSDNSTQRVLNLPPRVLFATLAPTFQHARCTNCHAGTATNFVAGSVPGLPAGHTAVSASTNCQTCHTNTLLPTLGTVNPGWHSPPATMDFRNLTPGQLCAKAKSVGGAAEVATHLKEDKLVLWSVGDGRRPNNATPLPLAPPGSIASWRTLVDAWVNAGMACE